MKMRQIFVITGLVAVLSLLSASTASADGYSFSFGYRSGRGYRPYHHHGGYYSRPSWSFGYTWGAPIYYWCPPPVAYTYYYAPTYYAPRYYSRPSPPVHYYRDGSFYTY